jgi:hypothetical protein
MQLNIIYRFVGTKHQEIYTLIDGVIHYKKIIKQDKNKSLKGIYLICYMNDVSNTYSIA